MLNCDDFLAEFGDLLEGKLKLELRRQLEAHLAHCQTCQVILRLDPQNRKDHYRKRLLRASRITFRVHRGPGHGENPKYKGLNDLRVGKPEAYPTCYNKERAVRGAEAGSGDAAVLSVCPEEFSDLPQQPVQAPGLEEQRGQAVLRLAGTAQTAKTSDPPSDRASGGPFVSARPCGSAIGRPGGSMGLLCKPARLALE